MASNHFGHNAFEYFKVIMSNTIISQAVYKLFFAADVIQKLRHIEQVFWKPKNSSIEIFVHNISEIIANIFHFFSYTL